MSIWVAVWCEAVWEWKWNDSHREKKGGGGGKRVWPSWKKHSSPRPQASSALAAFQVISSAFIPPQFFFLFIPSLLFFCLCFNCLRINQHQIYGSCFQSDALDTNARLCVKDRLDSLEVLVLSGGANLGRVALSQFVQASGVLKLELGLSAEELLQVLQQLQPGLGLLLQTAELLHQLVTDLCTSKRETMFRINTASLGDRACMPGLTSVCQTAPQVNTKPTIFQPWIEKSM